MLFFRKVPVQLGTAISLLLASTAACANPGQFMSKQYTEALGRAPDPGGWNAGLAQFAAQGCNKNTLIAMTKNVFTSAEYAGLQYDNAEKVLTAYRAIFSREPDPGGFRYWVSYLDNGNSIGSMIDFMYQGIDGAGELSTARICSSLGYGWGTQAVLGNDVIPAKTSGITTAAALQAALDAAQPGQTVYLPQRAVIRVGKTIVVKAGVTLATSGLPPRSQYAKQARLVRDVAYGSSELDSSVVVLQSGAKLDSVWVSGQKQMFPYNAASGNVALQGGTGTTLVNSRMDNAIGWASVIAHHYGTSCSAMLVSNNLVTGYANVHGYHIDMPGYTDGISGNCEDFTASYNTVIDASDIGIIVFSPGFGRVQNSQVRNNVVISAGVPAFGALMLHPQDTAKMGPTTSFAGAVIANNQFWAAPDTHFDIGLVLGGATWDQYPSIGLGGTASGNSTAGVATPMYIGLLVDGIRNATLSNNSITRAAPRASYADNPQVYRFSCPIGQRDGVADITNNHASNPGTTHSVVNAAAHTCISHPK